MGRENSHPRTVVLVTNQGSGSSDEHQASIHEALAGNSSLKLVSLPDRSELDAAVRDAVEAQPDIIVSAGGDGTARLVAHHMVAQQSESDLLVLPCGTANLLAKRLTGERSPEDLIKHIGSLRSEPISVGFANDSLFLLAIAAGFPATMGRSREAFRDSPSSPRRWLRSISAAMTSIGRARQRRLQVHSDGLPESPKRVSGLIAWINPSNSEGSHEAGDDHLNALVLGPDAWGEISSLASAATAGELSFSRTPAVFVSESIRVRSRRPVHIMLDGEPQFLDREVKLSIKPMALKVLTTST